MSTRVLSVVLVVLAAITGAGRPVPEDSVSVLVTVRVAFVRWPFDSTRDMIVRVKEPANDCTYLVDCESRTEECTKGERINAGGDDFAAVDLGGFGYLSGNHGSFFGHRQTVPGHGFAECDIGCEVMHVESGRTFRLVDVIDANTLLIHPDGETGPQPGFVYVENGTFRAKGRTWRPEKQVRGQLYPMSRYRRREWLDGKGCPIPDGVEVTLDSADLVIEHDVVDPRAVMRFLKEHPGRRFEPSLVTEPWPGPHVYLDDSASNGVLRAFAGLDSLFSVRTVYRYVPRCACTIHRKTTVNTTLASFLALDVTHGWDGSLPAWKDTLFYAPRMRPLTLAGKDGAPDVVVDLTRGVQLPWPCWKAQGTVKKTDCVDPENMPDRYIRVGGPKGRRLGVALGYSPVRGMTSRARKGADRPSAYFFWPTGKMYPHSFKALDVKPGTVFEHDAYKQYFDAEAEPDATSFYCHREGDSDYVYLDFHKTLQAKRIQLPDGFAGRSFRVLEKTPSVTLHTADAVLADGSILLDVSGGYGTLVLEVAPKREIVAKVDFTGPNPPERASCDVSGPFDLSDAPGISLDIRCSDLSQYQTFRFYFKSGKGGVYAHDGVTPEREGARHRLTVLKRDMNAVCVAVEGWNRLSGIRIIGDRAASPLRLQRVGRCPGRPARRVRGGAVGIARLGTLREGRIDRARISQAGRVASRRERRLSPAFGLSRHHTLRLAVISRLCRRARLETQIANCLIG